MTFFMVKMLVNSQAIKNTGWRVLSPLGILLIKQLNSMKTSTLKRFYINVKFEKYGTYTIEARSKEHAIEIYKDGDYGWSDYSEDFGEFNEQIEDVEEELFADTQLSLQEYYESNSNIRNIRRRNWIIQR